MGRGVARLFTYLDGDLVRDSLSSGVPHPLTHFSPTIDRSTFSKTPFINSLYGMYSLSL